MSTWIIEPRDPIIVRDGRPFGATPGARAASLNFPFPSTTTGGLRTRAGLGDSGSFDPRNIPVVKRIRVTGPLLVELHDDGEIAEWLAPAPSDALLMESDPGGSGSASLRRLSPLSSPVNAMTDLGGGLSPVGLARPDPRKPHMGAPRFWRWEEYERWLTSPSDRDIELFGLGHDGPSPEVRTHVRVRPDSQAAEEGALFQTRGLEFARAVSGKEGAGARILRLALAVSADTALVKPGLAPLGGERRIVSWRESRQEFPSCPEELRDRIAADGACRLMLLTPAAFAAGYRPSWLLSQREEVTPELRAAAVGRAQVVSGWDFERGRPKPTRRLAPTGSVFFFALRGGEDAIRSWVDTTWMRCVSDEGQDRLDGFGLAALGTWDGSVNPFGKSEVAS
jgi:CRISPR-associated protein Cmr3